MKYDVFISYSSKDRKVVDGICAYLEQRHIRCFVAHRDIPRGGSKPWAEYIVDALDESRMMLVAFSASFNASQQVNREIEIASEDKKPILTFRLSNDAFTGAKKYYLKNLNWLDAFPRPEKAFDEMYKQVCLLLGLKPVAADGGTAPQPPVASRFRGKQLLLIAALLLCVGIGVGTLRGCGVENPYPPVAEKDTVARVADTSAIITGEAIDLGLSVKWASCNVGASTPEEYGGYYAWGETEEKSSYPWSTYKYWNGDEKSMTKYCTDSSYGTVDNKTTLEPEDDVAHVQWGGSWRMPTLEEQMELINNCAWSWTTLNGVNGYRVTGPNGNSIFLPAAGYRNGEEVSNQSLGSFWSSALSSSHSDYACGLGFNSSYGSWSFYGYRYHGRSVRPVSE